MLAAVVCATLCGFRGLRPVVYWLELHGTAMWHLLGFTRKPPVRQTFAKVLAEVDPVVLEAVWLELIEPLDLPDCAESVAGIELGTLDERGFTSDQCRRHRSA